MNTDNTKVNINLLKENEKLMRYQKLQERTIKWAYKKGIFYKANPLAQIEKTLEEVNETKDAIFAEENRLFYYKDSKDNYKIVDEEIKDGFGDILVTILIGCEMQGLDPLDCLETALNVIEKRSGKMVNGKFEKDE